MLLLSPFPRRIQQRIFLNLLAGGGGGGRLRPNPCSHHHHHYHKSSSTSATTIHGKGRLSASMLPSHAPSSQLQYFSTQPQPSTKKESAQQYSIRRAQYKKAVSALRKQYAQEVSQQTQLDIESAQKQKADLTRKRLERQRRKNIRSAQNAMRQEEHRLQQKLIFEQHLVEQQVKREQREERFEKARNLVVEELNAQSKNWLTTPEEVDAALSNVHNPFIDQKLWTRPGSYVGEATPSGDSSNWRYESHTWKMQKTYKTAREKLLEEIEEYLYNVSNIDYNVYWNEDRVEHQKELEAKARLRALVLREGKNILLNKQRNMMQDMHSEQLARNVGSGDDLDSLVIPPKLDRPVPSTDILANYSAMEEEGVKVLRSDPTKFFRFENDNNSENTNDEGAGGDEADSNTTSSTNTTNLGRAIGLVDPVRDPSMTGTPYPELIGRLPPPDMRTDREKKKEEREKRMLAAANLAAAGGDEESNEVDADAENRLSFGDGDDSDVDYQHLANVGDDLDRGWEEGLDKNNPEHEDLFNVPWHERYTDDDIEWVASKLGDKLKNLEEILASEEGIQAAVTAARGGQNKITDEGRTAGTEGDNVDDSDDNDDDYDNEILEAMGPGTVKTTRFDEKGREYTSYDVESEVDGDNDFDKEDIESMLKALDLNDLIHLEDKDHVLRTLSDEQLSALQSIDDGDQENYEKTAEEVREALSRVPGLTETQVQSLVDLELSLAKNPEVQKQLKAKKE
mmetsp:Transcript_19804/g.29654  ORF Transcript_19804/g.29654 Transcript_19804/m.29654 type:complete len:739 (-) Transcript_19804:91-2307(-)